MDSGSEPSFDEEDLYDAYLAAALAGEAGTPEQFCRERGIESPRLVGLLEGLHRMVAGEAAGAEDRSADGSSEGAGALPRAKDGLPFERLGEFRLLDPIGEGAVGVVYLAEQEPLGRLVALKVLRGELSVSPAARARFLREARAIARLSHPSVVGIHGFGTDQDRTYLAMELLPGRSLAEVLGAGEVDVADVVRWCAELARGLAAAHAQGVVHRDVKPSNVRITSDRRAVLVDFGLARELDAADATLTASFAGSPGYAAPEQVDAARGDIGPPTDVYGLGAVLYEGLAGRPPFPVQPGEGLEPWLRRVLLEEPRPLRSLAPGISRDLATVCMRALERDPADRYPDGAAFAEDLEAVLALRPIDARPPGPLRRARRWAQRHRGTSAALVAALVVLVIGGGVGLVRGEMRARERRSEARGLVDEARATLDRHEEERAAAARARQSLASLRARAESEALSPKALSARWERQAAVDAYDRRQGVTHAGVLELLTRAAQLDPGAERLSDTLAMYYYQRSLDLRDHEDIGRRRVFEEAVARNDDSGVWSERLEGKAVLEVRSEPSGAELHLLPVRRLQDLLPDDPRAPHRWIPWHDETPANAPRPGELVLRVTEGAGPLQAGEVILALEGRAIEARATEDGVEAVCALAERGGLPATVWADGARTELALPAGLSVLPTAAPLLLGAFSAVGVTPYEPRRVPPGPYVAVLRADGFRELRVSFHIDHSIEPYTKDLALDCKLVRLGFAPPGFVRVAAGSYPWGKADYWLQAREVNAGEYLLFLNDTAVSADSTAYVPWWDGPFSEGNRSSAWPRSDAGYALPEGVDPAWPVLGVTRAAARAYASWRSQRDGLSYALPARHHWDWAAFGGDWRDFVFGMRFSPHWVNGRFGDDDVGPVAARERPVDESPVGVLALGGGAAEWLRADPENEEPGAGTVAGGSWLDASWDAFRIREFRTLAAGERFAHVGFRLVIEDEPE